MWVEQPIKGKEFTGLGKVGRSGRARSILFETRGRTKKRLLTVKVSVVEFPEGTQFAAQPGEDG